MPLDAYSPEGSFDEMYDVDGGVRPACTGFMERLDSLSDGELQERQRQAEASAP